MPRRKLTDEEKAARKAKAEFKKMVDAHTHEQDMSYDECMNAISRGVLRKPTYKFKVGDRVKYGNWDWAGIMEVLEDGLMYKVFKVTERVEYGIHKGAKFGMTYLLWTDIRPYVAPEDLDVSTPVKEDNDIRFSYSQRDVRSLISMHYNFAGLDMNPDYQRELVWTDEQKVALIDSIFKNIDIGKFTFIRRGYSSDFLYEVLDGKQRIQALIDFWECRFKYKGMTFNDLHWRDKNHFKSYGISSAETEPLTDEQKYRYFLKLNVSGIPIAEEHIERVKDLWKKSLTK